MNGWKNDFERGHHLGPCCLFDLEHDHLDLELEHAEVM